MPVQRGRAKLMCRLLGWGVGTPTHFPEVGGSVSIPVRGGLLGRDSVAQARQNQGVVSVLPPTVNIGVGRLVLPDPQFTVELDMVPGLDVQLAAPASCGCHPGETALGNSHGGSAY